MKRKDDLLRLAFGELSDDAARAFEASAGPSEKAELEAFRDLRASLQGLPTPPPDTLSADRLRAAILDGELKTRRAPKFSFAWAPLAVAALAAVVFVARPKAPVEPTFVSVGHGAWEKDIPNPKFEPLKDLEITPRNVAVPAPGAASMSINDTSASAARANPVRRRPVRRHARETMVASKAAVPYGPPATIVDKPVAMVIRPETTAIASPPSAVVASTFESLPPTGGDETVVIVSGRRDKDTGAPAATEMEAANVVVGG